jgi:hypothetical protein
MKSNFPALTVLLVTLITLMSSAVYADRGNRQVRSDHQKRSLPDSRVDNRYDHNRSYPQDGRIVKSLPGGRSPIRYRDKDYFYFGGVWYLSSGPYFSVVRPPIGIIIPILPSFYTTIWLSGIPYYYANDTYYLWRPDLNGYQVTAPPATESQPEPSYSADQIFIYPKQDQSTEQQAEDRYTCHRWGVDQTGYNPTQPPGNLSTDALSRLREDYNRAMKTCLEGKGYSVR